MQSNSVSGVHIIAALVCALIGFVGASLLQLVVARTPSHQRLSKLPQHCGNCGIDTQGVQRNPLTARLVKKRHCNHCQAILWGKAPGFEIFCAVLLGLAGLAIGWRWALPAYLVFFMTLAIITVIDLRHYLIPNRVIYPALFTTIGLLVAADLIDYPTSQLGRALIGMAGAWLFFFVVWFIYPRGMGFGDVRLSAIIGLMSGWVSYSNVVLSILLSLVIGALVGVVLIVLRFRNRKQAIPFGPFLAAGATISILLPKLLSS